MATQVQASQLRPPAQLSAAKVERMRQLLAAVPGAARPKKPLRASVRAALWLRQGDGRRFMIAAGGLAGALLTLFFITSALQSDGSREAAANKAMAEAKAAAKAHAATELRRSLNAQSVGSIVFASRERLCEEIKFNNRTGQLVSVDSVDCEARLTETTQDDEQAEKTARMRGVLESFKR
jgi:hypothetical protein